MKNLVLACAMLLVSIALVNVPGLRAQDSGQLTIQDPAEFNAYQTASTQSDPKAKAAALEDFVTKYPQSVVKKAVLDQLLDAYLAVNDQDKALSAATRLLQVDPNNPKALFYSIAIKKALCLKNIDPGTGVPKDAQSCDDSAALAQKGLTNPKPDGMTDAAWKTFTVNAYPIYHSAIASDDAVSKKDFKGAIDEYTKELMLYPPDATAKPGTGLADTLQLAYAYAKAGDSRDPVKACWFFARAWDFAPASLKPQIEQQLDYWYTRFHGTIDTPAQIKSQIDAIKALATSTLFPPPTYHIDPAPTVAELAHHALTEGDPKNLSLEDKEYILANGTKADADTLWGLVKDQPTPVPGIVISDPATALKVTVAGPVATVKPKEYVVKLNTPGPCASIPPAPSELQVKEAIDYLNANGAAADIAAIPELEKAKKLLVEPAVTSIAMAVTHDAQDSKRADFDVNLKDPLPCKDAPAPGFEMKTLPASEELDATYDTFTTTPAAGSTDASAEIVLRDGFVQMPKAAPVHRAAPAGARPPVHRTGM